MEEPLEVDELSDESLIVTKWMPVRSTLLVIFIAGILILGVLSRGAMINFIRKMAPDRPISKNILLNQVIELPNFTIMGIMILVSLITSIPIEETFGYTGSVIFWISTVVHNLSGLVGECGVALYRLICVKDLGFALNVQRAEKLMKKILTAELLFEVSLTMLLLLAGHISNQPMALAVAQGHSLEMEQIIHPKAGNKNEKLGGQLVLFTVAFGFAAMIVELVCYINIYAERYSTNEKIKSAIPKKVVAYRRRRNVVSLSTQVIGITIEMISIIVGGLIVGFQLADPSVFIIASLVSSSIVPTMHVLGSAEMVQYYFNSLSE